MNRDSLITALSRFLTETKNLSDETHEAEDRRIYERYLANAGVILAKVAQNQGVGDDIDTMERLFGNAWLKDGKAYARAYALWDEFKSLLTQSIHGMTVNERLSTLGLFDDFDRAVEDRDESRLRAILSKCFLDKESIQAIIAQELKEKG
jgi:hypothetical protein